MARRLVASCPNQRELLGFLERFDHHSYRVPWGAMIRHDLGSHRGGRGRRPRSDRGPDGDFVDSLRSFLSYGLEVGDGWQDWLSRGSANDQFALRPYGFLLEECLMGPWLLLVLAFSEP